MNSWKCMSMYIAPWLLMPCAFIAIHCATVLSKYPLHRTTLRDKKLHLWWWWITLVLYLLLLPPCPWHSYGRTYLHVRCISHACHVREITKWMLSYLISTLSCSPHTNYIAGFDVGAIYQCTRSPTPTPCLSTPGIICCLCACGMHLTRIICGFH